MLGGKYRQCSVELSRIFTLCSACEYLPTCRVAICHFKSVPNMQMQTRITTCLLAVAIIVSCLLVVPANSYIIGHTLSKRSFFDIQCKGVYNKEIFAELDKVCEDCYNLFKEPQLHTLCRKGCFTTYFFKGCMEALLYNDDELEDIKRKIKVIHGADPGV